LTSSLTLDLPFPPVAEFVTPAALRVLANREQGQKYRERKEKEQDKLSRVGKQREAMGEDELEVKKVFA
jgi:hypothetical protein